LFQVKPQVEFIGKIRLLGGKLPTSLLTSAAFLKIQFSFQPPVLKMLVWGKTHFQAELAGFAPN
jgi:hypothetical protein